jgi:flagellar motor switch protein FliG
MARQEVIDGPGVAAKILSRFPAEEREHLVATIRAEAPQIAAALERRMVDLAKTERAPVRAPRNLPREVRHREIITSHPTVQEPMEQRLLPNISETTLEVVREDTSALPPLEITNVEEAKARILRRLEELYPGEGDSNSHKPFKSRLA